jgi:two-component system, LytTR family, sensor kinase
MTKVSSLFKSKYVTVTLHVLIWGAVLLLPFFLNSPREHTVQIGYFRCNFFTMTNAMHLGLFYLNAFFLYTHLMTRSRWWIYVLCLATLVIVFYYLKTWMLTAWFPVLATEDAAFRFTFFPTVFFLAISTIYRLVRDKINQEKMQTRLEAEHLAMELKFLRSQVSPHFLFNVLNNLVSMARHKSDQLEPSLIKLSELIRYMLYASDEKKVPMEIEIQYLKSYIELQKLRFEESVEIGADIQLNAYAGSIEPMLLIPFVENAFKHGVSDVQNPFIHIALDITNNRLRFKVENKFGDDAQVKDGNSGIGLTNLKARLNLLYPRLHELSIVQADHIFHVDLSLQLR